MKQDLNVAFKTKFSDTEGLIRARHATPPETICELAKIWNHPEILEYQFLKVKRLGSTQREAKTAVKLMNLYSAFKML